MNSEHARIEAEFRASRARERADARRAARNFHAACVAGDLERFPFAVHDLTLTIGGWRLAMRKVAKLPQVSEELQLAFLDVWVQSKNLRIEVDDRRALASALRVLMPRTQCTAPLTVFRGATAMERKRRAYGFSWTTSQETALSFAAGRAQVGRSAVVMRAVATPDAILHVRDKPDAEWLRLKEEGGDSVFLFDEDEVVVDPFKLGKIDVVERLDATTPARTAATKITTEIAGASKHGKIVQLRK